MTDQVFEDVVLAADSTLMNECLTTIVKNQNKLMDLDVVEATEHVDESVHVARFDSREEHSLLDLELSIFLLHLLDLSLLLGAVRSYQLLLLTAQTSTLLLRSKLELLPCIMLLA